MKKVRLFGDWSESSDVLTERLARQTEEMEEDTFRDLQFVSDDSYSHAVIFNYPTNKLKTHHKRNIGLVVEPPEIVEAFYPEWHGKNFVPGVSQYFSTSSEMRFTHQYGIGFSSVEPVSDGFKTPDQIDHTIQMIASTKVMTDWHGKRREVFEALLNTDLPINFWGRGLAAKDYGHDPRIRGGFSKVEKQELLRRSSICIEFENSSHGLITDKYFDSVLSHTLPVSNAKSLFRIAPKHSFRYVDFNAKTKGIVDQITEVVRAPVTEEEGRAVVRAKKSVLSGNMSLANWIYTRIHE